MEPVIRQKNAVEAVAPFRFETFLKRYPAFLETSLMDELRRTDYSRLNRLGQVYLDFTGGNLYAESQLQKHFQLLRDNVFGNPHSTNPTSIKATHLVEAARQKVLDYFNTQGNYECIFTANASGALKIIGESYPFHSSAHFLLTYDNHNSVNGIREFCKSKGGSFSYTPLNVEDLRINPDSLLENLAAFPDKTDKLFAYPAQSNVTGIQHSLDWIESAKGLGWDVLLDAAAFVPSNRLDLSKVRPDFVSVSFYKIFGYPTGLGCLLVHRDTFHKLQKPWFAGGTITLASVKADHYYLSNTYERFEDGTVNYLDIPAVQIGLEHIEHIGIDTIHERVHCLTNWLLDEIPGLRHDNGRPLIHLYGPSDRSNRGGTLIMNFLDVDGRMYPFEDIEYFANEHNISLRTGCFCNPGIDETLNCIHETEIDTYFQSHEKGNYKDMIQFLGKLRGAIRISLGLASNFPDVEAFLAFARKFLNQSRGKVM